MERVNIKVVKNGYILEEYNNPLTTIPTASAIDEYVFETLDSLFNFLRDNFKLEET